MAQLFTNDARSKLTGPITSTSLSLLIDPTDQARFPIATGANWFKIKLEDASGNIEYVRVQRASGSSTLTVASTGERGYEEPTKFPAASWPAGVAVELIATAADLQASLAHPSVSTDAHDASAISFTPAGSIAATEVQAAIEELDGNFASYLRNTVGSWINDAGSAARLFFTNVGATIIKGFGSTPFSVQNSAGTTILSVSDAGVAASSADAAASGDLARLGQTEALIKAVCPPGSILPMARLTAPSGWLLINGETIGSAASGATARANADTADLFAELWAFPAASVPIYDNTGAVSTRGASAAADFAAGKRLPLFTPDGGAFLRMWTPGQTTDAGRSVGSTQAPYAGSFTVSAGSDDGDNSGGSLQSVRYMWFNGVQLVGNGAGGGTVTITPGDTHGYNLAMPHYIKL